MSFAAIHQSFDGEDLQLRVFGSPGVRVVEAGGGSFLAHGARGFDERYKKSHWLRDMFAENIEVVAVIEFVHDSDLPDYSGLEQDFGKCSSV